MSFQCDSLSINHSNVVVEESGSCYLSQHSPKKTTVSHEALIQASADLYSEICSIRAIPPEYDVNTINCGVFSPSPTLNPVLKSKLSQTIAVCNRVILNKDHFGEKLPKSYSVGGFSPYFLATSVWA